MITQRQLPLAFEEVRPDDDEEFESLRLELINFLLQTYGVSHTVRKKLTHTDRQFILARLYQRRSGLRRVDSFIGIILRDTLAMKRWSRFTCQDLREHIAHVQLKVEELSR